MAIICALVLLSSIVSALPLARILPQNNNLSSQQTEEDSYIDPSRARVWDESYNVCRYMDTEEIVTGPSVDTQHECEYSATQAAAEAVAALLFYLTCYGSCFLCCSLVSCMVIVAMIGGVESCLVLCGCSCCLGGTAEGTRRYAVRRRRSKRGPHDGDRVVYLDDESDVSVAASGFKRGNYARDDYFPQQIPTQ